MVEDLLPSQGEDTFLEREWTFWFDEKPRHGTRLTEEQYQQLITDLGSFHTVQGFWAYWGNLHVDHLKNNLSLRLFQRGMLPTWEDPNNLRGGRWVCRGVPPEERQRYWSELVLLLIGENLEQGPEGVSVNGVVLSTKRSGDVLQVWVKGRDDGGGAEFQEFLQQQVLISVGSLSAKSLEFTYTAHFVQETLEAATRASLNLSKAPGRTTPPRTSGEWSPVPAPEDNGTAAAQVWGGLQPVLCIPLWLVFALDLMLMVPKLGNRCRADRAGVTH